MNKIIVNLGGGTPQRTERRQALGLSPRLPKGGQRRSPNGQLIESEGSYGN